MTRIENLTYRDLLTEYIKQNYRSKDILVIFSNMHELDVANVGSCLGIFNKLFHDLESFGFSIAPAMRLPGVIIVDAINIRIATEVLMDYYDKAPFTMELWRNGACIGENQ